MRKVRGEKQYLRNMCWIKEAWFNEAVGAKEHGIRSCGVWRGKPGGVSHQKRERGTEGFFPVLHILNTVILNLFFY